MLVMVSSFVDYELLKIWLLFQRLATLTGLDRPTLQTAFFCTTLLEVGIWPNSDLNANYHKSVQASTLVCHLAGPQRLCPRTTRKGFQGKSPTKLIQGKVSVEIGGEDRPGFRSAVRRIVVLGFVGALFKVRINHFPQWTQLWSGCESEACLLLVQPTRVYDVKDEKK